MRASKTKTSELVNRIRSKTGRQKRKKPDSQYSGSHLRINNARRRRSGVSRNKKAVSARDPGVQRKYKCKFHHFETVNSTEWKRHLNTLDHRRMTVMHEGNIFFVVRSKEIEH